MLCISTRFRVLREPKSWSKYTTVESLGLHISASIYVTEEVRLFLMLHIWRFLLQQVPYTVSCKNEKTHYTDWMYLNHLDFFEFKNVTIILKVLIFAVCHLALSQIEMTFRAIGLTWPVHNSITSPLYSWGMTLVASTL